VVLLLVGGNAFARAPHTADTRAAHSPEADHPAIDRQQFLREYGLGVQRLPMDGGKIYGWKLNDRVTFGRFKGESDEFGFSFEVDERQRVEITTDGLRWRKAIGGGR
jgi:hypothetical protein